MDVGTFTDSSKAYDGISQQITTPRPAPAEVLENVKCILYNLKDKRFEHLVIEFRNYIDDESLDFIQFCRSGEGYHMELVYDMTDFGWDVPLVLGCDDIIYEEAIEITEKICAGEQTGDIDIVNRCFKSIGKQPTTYVTINAKIDDAEETSEITVLYSIIEDNGDEFTLCAYMLPDGRLQLEGQDFCETAEEIFGDEEYEYYFTFDAENTEKLKNASDATDILFWLKDYFGGEMRNEEFEDFCEENGIEYEIFVV